MMISVGKFNKVKVNLNFNENESGISRQMMISHYQNMKELLKERSLGVLSPGFYNYLKSVGLFRELTLTQLRSKYEENIQVFFDSILQLKTRCEFDNSLQLLVLENDYPEPFFD